MDGVNLLFFDLCNALHDTRHRPPFPCHDISRRASLRQMKLDTFKLNFNTGQKKKSSFYDLPSPCFSVLFTFTNNFLLGILIVGQSTEPVCDSTGMLRITIFHNRGFTLPGFYLPSTDFSKKISSWERILFHWRSPTPRLRFAFLVDCQYWLWPFCWCQRNKFDHTYDAWDTDEQKSNKDCLEA